MKNKWLVHYGIVRFNLAISGVIPTGCKIAADNLCPRVLKREISIHILKEELFVGGGKIGHHVSQIASWVTNDHNMIRIFIIF